MKNKFLILSLTVTLVLLFNACDYIRNANPPSTASSTGSTTATPGVVYRKVLVEDYTGHKCGNCPAAADVLKDLETQYAGKIVPLAIHAGFFANTNTQYPTNFANADGNAYDTQFGIS